MVVAETVVRRLNATKGLHQDDPVASPPSQFGISTLSAFGVRALIAPLYPIGRIDDVVLLRHLIHDTYLIVTEKLRFALKVYRLASRKFDEIAEELRAIKYFSEHGIRVALPVPRHDDQFITEIHAPEGVRYAVLFEWLDGYPPDYKNPDDLARMGEALAKLHVAGSLFDIAPARRPIDMDFLFESSLARLQPHVSRSASLTKRMNAIVSAIRPEIDTISNSLKEPSACHGDLDPTNVVITSEGVHLFDFDCCGLGWPVYDVATFMWAASFYKIENVCFTPFLESYFDIRSADRWMLGHVPLFITVRHFWVMGQAASLANHIGRSIISTESLEAFISLGERFFRQIR